MDEYGFSAGLLQRVFRKILPEFPDPDTVEFFILKQAHMYK